MLTIEHPSSEPIFLVRARIISLDVNNKPMLNDHFKIGDELIIDIYSKGFIFSSDGLIKVVTDIEDTVVPFDCLEFLV